MLRSNYCHTCKACYDCLCNIAHLLGEGNPGLICVAAHLAGALQAGAGSDAAQNRLLRKIVCYSMDMICMSEASQTWL